MKPTSVMLIAGEPSGDWLGAELVRALRPALAQRQSSPATDAQPLHTGLVPQFFGAGGPRMAEAGVELALDLTTHAVIGLWEVLRNYAKFRRLFGQLLQLAIDRQPDAIVCVDFSGFNGRLARAVREHLSAHRSPFYNWRPKLIQYVSPQVWASRPGRADAMAGNFDLLLSIFPFEKTWYAKRVPEFRVEFVGHPILDRYAGMETQRDRADGVPLVLLLPGSRAGELRRHLPVILPAAKRAAAARKGLYRMVLPDANLLPSLTGQLAAEIRRAPGASAGPADPLAAARQLANEFLPGLQVQVGGLAESLTEATLAIASTGTVTMECAYFGVPTIALYRTSWSTYQIAKRLVQVKFLAMPNLLANEAIVPEYIQHEATAENLAREALDLLNSPARRQHMRARLAQVVATLGGPGASQRAAQAVLSIL